MLRGSIGNLAGSVSDEGPLYSNMLQYRLTKPKLIQSTNNIKNFNEACLMGSISDEGQLLSSRAQYHSAEPKLMKTLSREHMSKTTLKKTILNPQRRQHNGNIKFEDSFLRGDPIENEAVPHCPSNMHYKKNYRLT